MSATQVQVQSLKRSRSSYEPNSELKSEVSAKKTKSEPKRVNKSSTAKPQSRKSKDKQTITPPETPPVKPEVIESEVVSEIHFSASHQSILSITHFKEPLKIQTEYPIPELGPHEVLVHNKAIGLNPIDWKGKKFGFGIYHFPWINGRESSGKVVKLGTKVSGFQIGDKVVVSSTSYRDNRTSTFQQYTAIDSRLVWRLPQSFTYEDGATIGVGLVTAGILFYNSFGFKLEKEPPQQKGTILIWGGATIVGIYLAQLAKLYGLKVVSVASTKHESYLREIGVDVLVDRYLSDDEIEQQVAAASPEGIAYGIDCVSKETSLKVINLLDKNHKNLKSEADKLRKPLFAGIVGVPKEYPESVEPREVVIKRFHEDLEFGAKFIETTTSFLDQQLIRPARYKQYKGGLEIIDDALKDLEKIGGNGEKYVVSV